MHFTDLCERWGQFGALLSVAASVAAVGDAESAARVVAGAEAFSQMIGAAPIPVGHDELTFASGRVAELLGSQQAEALFSSGRTMPIADLVAFALDLTFERCAARPERPDGLTAREAEVLELLARRSTNREIADALVLNIRTVESHISNIYAKTGISTRREAAEYLQQPRARGLIRVSLPTPAGVPPNAGTTSLAEQLDRAVDPAPSGRPFSRALVM